MALLAPKYRYDKFKNDIFDQCVLILCLVKVEVVICMSGNRNEGVSRVSSR